MDNLGKALATLRQNSPTKRENSNLQRALGDRLLLSEAIDLVGKLVRAYPNGGANADKGYIGTLAALLCEFPKQVALRCADPIRGVTRETKFLPTVSDVVAWCERETEPLRRDVDREQRVAKQIEAREKWDAGARPTPPPARRSVTYGEFVAECEAKGQQPRSIGAFERGGYLGPSGD